MDNTILPAHVSVEDAARYLHVHPETVRRFCREGRIPAQKIGKVYHIAIEDLRAVQVGHAVSGG